MKNLVQILPISKSDLNKVARVHILAFPESALTQLGIEAIQRYYSWQLNGPHNSLCIGAFDDTKMIGFCFAGVFRGAETGFLYKNRFFLAWYLITHPCLLRNEIVRNRLKYSIQAIKRKLRQGKKRSKVQKSDKGKFGILSIAVHPKYQGLGIGKLLMQNIATSAREQGFNAMRLTVHTDKQQAVLFYKKLGWQPVPAKDGIWRGLMVKNLDDCFE